MGEVMLLVLNLFFVKEIQKTDAEAVIVFASGQEGRLSASHRDFDYFMRLAQGSLERGHPVAVSMAEPDKIVELARADNDVPSQFVEHDQERMKVLFQGHDGIFYLRRKHADYRRISELIQQSIKEKSRVWFAAEKPALLITDAVSLEKASGPK